MKYLYIKFLRYASLVKPSNWNAKNVDKISGRDCVRHVLGIDLVFAIRNYFTVDRTAVVAGPICQPIETLRYVV